MTDGGMARAHHVAPLRGWIWGGVRFRRIVAPPDTIFTDRNAAPERFSGTPGWEAQGMSWEGCPVGEARGAGLWGSTRWSRGADSPARARPAGLESGSKLLLKDDALGFSPGLPKSPLKTREVGLESGSAPLLTTMPWASSPGFPHSGGG